MSIPNKILKEFDSLEEFTKFIREQINDGEQISAGKSETEQSKEKKKEEKPEDAPEPPSEGGDAPEGEGEEDIPEPGTEGEFADAEGGEAAAEEPVVDPVGMPGSQVNMGGIDPEDKKDKKVTNPNAVEVELKGEGEEIDLKPTLQVDLTKR